MGQDRMHAGFWWGNLKERNCLEDLDAFRRIILKLVLKNWDERVWNALMWLRLGTGDRLLQTQELTFGLHEMWGIS